MFAYIKNVIELISYKNKVVELSFIKDIMIYSLLYSKAYVLSIFKILTLDDRDFYLDNVPILLI